MARFILKRAVAGRIVKGRFVPNPKGAFGTLPFFKPKRKKKSNSKRSKRK